MSQPTDGVPTQDTLQESIVKAVTAWAPGLMRPILGFRRAYLPLLMVYFAYGTLGIIDVSRDMWIKERLTLTPAELAGIGVWPAALRLASESSRWQDYRDGSPNTSPAKRCFFSASSFPTPPPQKNILA